MLRLDRVDALMVMLVILWGTAFVSIRELSRVLDPFELTWLRYVPFLLVYGGWLMSQRKKLARVGGGDWIRFTVAGALGVIGYHIPLNWAMSDLTPGTPVGASTAAILVATTPLWTLMMAVAIGQERLDRTKTIGTLVAFAGVVIVVLRGSGVAQLDIVGKALIALIAPVLWGGYSIVAKPLIGRFGGLFVTGLTMCLGTLVFLPFGLSRGTEPLLLLDGRGWFWLLYLSIVATVLGYTIWNWALQQRSASELTAYIFGVPVVATIAGAILLAERITVWFVLGAGLVIAGLATIHKARLRAMRTPPVNS